MDRLLEVPGGVRPRSFAKTAFTDDRTITDSNVVYPDIAVRRTRRERKPRREAGLSGVARYRERVPVVVLWLGVYLVAGSPFFLR
jgi:hypothetical protein